MIFWDVGCGISWIMDRRKVLMYAGPVWAAVTLIFWFPVTTDSSLLTAVHYFIALFSYDTLMTLVVSAYCGLCVEVGATHKGRVNIIVLGELVAIVAGFIIFPIEFFSENLKNYSVFQICCVVTCCIGAALMIFSGYNLEPRKQQPDDMELNRSEEHGEGTDEMELSKALRISWEIIRQPRFICLVFSNFFRTMRALACDQFLLIFVESLLSRNGFLPVGSADLSLFYILVRNLGRALFLIIFLPVQRSGAHPTMLFLNIFALAGAIAYYFIGRNNYLLLAGYIVLENTLCRCGVYGLYTVIAGEVIDTDTALHKRRSPLSTLIFTIKALFNKPAEQLAPIFVLLLLDRGGYSANKVACGAVARRKSDIIASVATISLNSTTYAAPVTTVDSAECVFLFDSMFQVLIFWPVLCIVGESLFLALDLYFKKKLTTLMPSEKIDLRDRALSMSSIQESTNPV